MKITVVPAQVTTVEDRIIGSLGFSQILLLIIPVFGSAGIFALLPPVMNGETYKYVLMAIIVTSCSILAFRIKGKIIAHWLVLVLRYNLRPKYYLFNKNVSTMREEYLVKESAEATKQTTKPMQRMKPVIPQLDIPTTARLLATLNNPAAQVHFVTGKKGNLYVRLTEIEDQN